MGELLHKLVQMCSGSNQNKEENAIENNKIRGKLVLKNLDASCLDHIYEFFGKRVSLQLISADHGDQENGLKGKLGKPTLVQNWRTTLDSATEEGDATFDLKFEWEKSMGVPGAFLIRNHHHSEFYLKTVTLEHIPDHGRVHFICNSWVYPAHRYKYDRVFFTNKTYLPHNTPEPLRQYREEELINLRGNGSGLLKKWDRVYDYAYYNDLGSPEKGKDYERPVLGGPNGYPYPRRGRTGRPPTKKDPNTESRLPLIKSLGIYVPRDERFSDIKFEDFLLYAKKSIIQLVVAELAAVDLTITEFDDFEDVMKLYGEGVELKKISKCMQWEALKGCVSSEGEPLLKFPKPDVIKADRSAWRTDEEFAREMLAGVNPVSIRLLREFPPTSKLDPKLYGNQKSSIRREGIQEIIKTTTGLTVDDALKENKLFILDHHDALMPYLRRINTTNTKTYASRTLLLLQNDGTLKPLAIELSLPHPQGDKHGAVSRVFSPASDGSVQEHVWQLAKAYAAVNDSGYHQLISHWLNTHAVIEPFVIATNRQLSVVHPIYKLLHPHFRDTMHINANARTILINAGGVLEMTVFPARFSMEMSSILYKDWVFTEHSLPADLLKRGVAVADSTQPHGLRLLIEDYPFAVDGLEIWSAIETWVTEYCCFYYSTDESIQVDSELQQWWTEIREKGHGDKKDEPWWPTMHTRGELIMTCSIMIWVSSALHAAVNFGQYPYAGFLPNRPTVSRRFMPEPGTHEYAELESKPDLAFLKTITAQFQTLLGVSLIEILSRHSRDEIYLGQRETPEWTSDHQVLESFERFGSTLIAIERRIEERNKDARLKNRVGPIEMEYTLLMPNTADYTKTSRLAGKGIPNSISI